MTPPRWLSLAILPLLLSACYKEPTTAGTTPAPPTPWQITVAQSNLSLAHALNGAVDALTQCRTQQKCSAVDVAQAESVVTAIATAGKAVDAELASKDADSVQKQKILALVTAAGVAQLKSRVSASTQLLLTGVIALYDNISLAVGGPTL